MIIYKFCLQPLKASTLIPLSLMVYFSVSVYCHYFARSPNQNNVYHDIKIYQL